MTLWIISNCCLNLAFFYRETIILEQVKKEELVAILTPSDEAFLLLLLVVYFEDRTDTEYSTMYEGNSLRCNQDGKKQVLICLINCIVK